MTPGPPVLVGVLQTLPIDVWMWTEAPALPPPRGDACVLAWKQTPTAGLLCTAGGVVYCVTN